MSGASRWLDARLASGSEAAHERDGHGTARGAPPGAQERSFSFPLLLRGLNAAYSAAAGNRFGEPDESRPSNE